MLLVTWLIIIVVAYLAAVLAVIVVGVVGLWRQCWFAEVVVVVTILKVILVIW